MYSLEALNRTLFLDINGGEGTAVFLIQTARVLADYLIYLVPLLLTYFWLWGDHQRRHVAVKASVVALCGVAINQAIAMVFPHPRPFMVGLGHTWISHAADSSFPSDHMTIFAGIALTLLLEGAHLWGIAVLAIGLLVAWARVFLGVHFPLDMAGAVVVALTMYFVVSPFWRRLGDGLVPLMEDLYRIALGQLISRGWIRR